MTKKIPVKTVPKTVIPINYTRDFFLALTSNKGKIFSQKKIFLLIAFVSMLILTIIYLVRNINKIEPLQFVEIVALWLAYGGYNSYANYRDRKLHKDDPTASESTDTTVIDNNDMQRMD